MEEGVKRKSSVGAERQETCMEIIGSLAGELPESRRDIFNAPDPIMQLLQAQAHAYAMVGSGHLGSWALYNSRLMKFYTNEPSPHFRFCTAQKAEDVDQRAMREVFGLLQGCRCVLLGGITIPTPKSPRLTPRWFSDPLGCWTISFLIWCYQLENQRG